MSSLNKAKIGQVVSVNKIIGNSNISRRIMELGITKGVKILIKKFAPLGDPMQIQFRGYSLFIRKREAENILIN